MTKLKSKIIDLKKKTLPLVLISLVFSLLVCGVFFYKFTYKSEFSLAVRYDRPSVLEFKKYESYFFSLLLFRDKEVDLFKFIEVNLNNYSISKSLKLDIIDLLGFSAPGIEISNKQVAKAFEVYFESYLSPSMNKKMSGSPLIVEYTKNHRLKINFIAKKKISMKLIAHVLYQSVVDQINYWEKKTKDKNNLRLEDLVFQMNQDIVKSFKRNNLNDSEKNIFFKELDAIKFKNSFQKEILDYYNELLIFNNNFSPEIHVDVSTLDYQESKADVSKLKLSLYVFMVSFVCMIALFFLIRFLNNAFESEK